MSIFTEPDLLNSQRWKNMRIGLLGGSFNPPHKGHIHISKMALKTLDLDVIWWLVTPQNPMKSKDGLPTATERKKLCASMLKNEPRILATTIEEKLNTTYSHATISKLKTHFPKTDFAWITGMDNAHNLHLWERWKDILAQICIVHITRHPPIKLVKNCPVRMLSSQRHIILVQGGRIPLTPHTTYWLLQKKMINISSTKIRNNHLKSKP